jgi:hypothetical protein
VEAECSTSKHLKWLSDGPEGARKWEGFQCQVLTFLIFCECFLFQPKKVARLKIDSISFESFLFWFFFLTVLRTHVVSETKKWKKKPVGGVSHSETTPSVSQEQTSWLCPVTQVYLIREQRRTWQALSQRPCLGIQSERGELLHLEGETSN